MKQPDPKLHQQISFAKSLFRVMAGSCMMGGSFTWAGFLFILAEILGVVEELV